MREASDFFKRACLNGSVENYLKISISGSDKDIENDEIVSESMKLNQSICDDSDIKFGGCIASQFEIEITRDVDLTGREITVFLYQKGIVPTYPTDPAETGNTDIVTYPTEPMASDSVKTYPGFTVIEGGYGDNPFYLFHGTIYSCKLAKNRIIRKIVAYDDFYLKGNIDCTNWYRSLYSSANTITLGTLRGELLKKFKIRQATNNSYSEPVALPADDLPVHMIEGDVTVGELFRQICEFNGCFGFMNGEGLLEYITVSGNYDSDNSEVYRYYIDIETEDFSKSSFDGFYITGFEEGKGIYELNSGSEDNLYFLEDNQIITAGYKASEFGLIFNNVDKSSLGENFSIHYDPINLKSEYRSWVEIGDKIRVVVKWYNLNGEECSKRFDSIVFSRSLSGIQAITDEITANGENIRYTEDYFDSLN